MRIEFDQDRKVLDFFLKVVDSVKIFFDGSGRDEAFQTDEENNEDVKEENTECKSEHEGETTSITSTRNVREN